MWKFSTPTAQNHVSTVIRLKSLELASEIFVRKGLCTLEV